MAQTKKQKQGEQTRAAILAAAETLFAEHGFDGTRVDGIAELAGHNKALIFRYFGSKLGLYAEVLKRADVELSALLKRVFAALLADDSIAMDAGRFRAFLETTLGVLFDYMVAHPQFTRMINWEQAAAWQTFAPIAAQFEPADFERLAGIFAAAKAGRLLREDLDVVLGVLLVQQLCWTAPNSLALYQLFLAERNFTAAQTLAHIRAQVIALGVAGLQPAALNIQKG